LTTYTLYNRLDFAEEIIGRGMSALSAMRHIIPCEEGRYSLVFSEGYEHFRRVDLGIFQKGRSKGERILQATVPVTDDVEADLAVAMEMIAEQFLRIAHKYWDGHIRTDEEFDEGLQYAADREDADRLEYEIAAEFVDLLARNGYTIVRDMACSDFAIDDLAGRIDFLQHVTESLIGGLTVYKPGAIHSFRFNFGVVGWDIIQDSTGALSALIDEVVGPHKAKGHPAKIGPVAGGNTIEREQPDDNVKVLAFKPFG
jgi:hypothetical protein